MGATQLLLTGAQLHGALLHQFQCALALAHQHVKQRTEQGAEQHAHRQNGVHRRMVGPVEHFAGAQAQGVDMIAQGEAARSRQAAAAQGVAGGIQHPLLGVGGVYDLHHQVVTVGPGQPLGHQLAHADHRHHKTIRLGPRDFAHGRHQ